MPMLHRPLSNLPIGERILIGGSRSDLSLATILDFPNAEDVRVTTSAGAIMTIRHGKVVEARARLLWTDLLPVGADEQVIAYAKAILDTEVDRATWAWAGLLHVERIEDGKVIARPVHPIGPIDYYEESARVAAEGRAKAGFTEEEPIPSPAARYDTEMGDSVIHGNAAFVGLEVFIDEFNPGQSEYTHASPVGFVGSLGIGDLVATSDFDLDFVDGKYFARLRKPAVIGNFASRDAVGAFLPYGTEQRVMYHPTKIADSSHVYHFACRAQASADPDEALVICFDTTSHPGHTDYSVIANNGALFFLDPGAADYMDDQLSAPGLWVITDATVRCEQSYDGEYDSWLEGEWRPATPEDIARFGFKDMAELDRKICEGAVDWEETDGIALRYMELAEKAVIEEAERVATMAAPAP